MFPALVRPRVYRVAGAGSVAAAAGIAVAGTPTSLAAIELSLEPYDPQRVHGHLLALRSHAGIDRADNTSDSMKR